MGVRSDVGQLGPLEMVEMFVYDDRGIGGGTVLRWHAGTKPGTNLPIVWQGEEYMPFPIEASGFDIVAAEKLPRPMLRASNIGGALGAYIRTIQDALGAIVIRKRTLGKYLDAGNFPDGNPYADPNTAFPDELYYISRKATETAIYIEMELAVPFDVQGVQLPRRQVLASTCQWIYRSAGCSYNGPPVQDINGNPTGDPARDQCRKTLSACRARFGDQGVLRSSAFPASLLAQYQ